MLPSPILHHGAVHVTLFPPLQIPLCAQATFRTCNQVCAVRLCVQSSPTCFLSLLHWFHFLTFCHHCRPVFFHTLRPMLLSGHVLSCSSPSAFRLASPSWDNLANSHPHISTEHALPQRVLRPFPNPVSHALWHWRPVFHQLLATPLLHTLPARVRSPALSAPGQAPATHSVFHSLHLRHVIFFIGAQ